MSKLKAPLNVTGVMTGGNEYRADEHGIVELADDTPGADVQAMLASGWTRIVEEDAPAPAKLAGKPAKGAATDDDA